MIAKPAYKVGRRLGAAVFDKCQTQKFAVSEAKHAKSAKRGGRKTSTDFSKQLIEKQRIRFAYGIMERQLRRYVEEAQRVRTLGVDPSLRMLEQLEMRLDNVVYRIGLAKSRRGARQLVSHGHITVNGVRSTIPSQALKVGDVVAVRAATTTKPIMEIMKNLFESATVPVWLSFDGKKFEGKVLSKPNAEITEMPGSVGAILEFYSR